MPTATNYYRKIIRIRAEDSPNVQLGLAQQAMGLAPTGNELLPGVLSWHEYQKRRATWDPVRQCIGLDGLFWKGSQVLLFPPLWLDNSERLYQSLGVRKREAKGLGVDPAEGGDSTTIAVVDEIGLLELMAWKTPDTSVIRGNIAATMKRYNLRPDQVCIDRGGGGKQIADEMRAAGHKGIRTIAFGEAVSLEIKRGLHQIVERKEVKEEQYAYLNRRAQMYFEARQLIDPNSERKGWAISPLEKELRRQLSVMPLLYDSEGRVKMLPKNKTNPNDTRQTLVSLLGCSPDEADAMVLAIHAMLHKGTRTAAGAIG